MQNQDLSEFGEILDKIQTKFETSFLEGKFTFYWEKFAVSNFMSTASQRGAPKILYSPLNY